MSSMILLLKFCFSDVLPYGIYMLTYEYLSKRLSATVWMSEKRKYSENKNFEVLIPICSGAIAG